MKKFVSLLLALVMVLSLAACGSGDTPAESKAPEESKAPDEVAFVPYTYEDEEVYMNAMGEYYAAMQKAKAAEDVDEMYALLALAEAKLMETGTFMVFRGDGGGGGYVLSRMVDKSVPSVQWGTDYRRYETAIVTNEILKAEDREEMRSKWGELAGTGTYEQWVKDFLAEKGYTLKDTLGYWDYSSDPESWDTLSKWTSTVGDAVCQTVEGLVKYDMENKLQPALAESWEEGTGTIQVAKLDDEGNVIMTDEKDENGNPIPEMEEKTVTTWTFHIREGAVWTDAQGRKIADVKADDWVASMQHMFDWYGESGAEVIAPNIVNGMGYCNGEIIDFSQVGVKAVDDHTLVYYLNAPWNTFESALTYCGFFAPLCREYYESKGGKFGVDVTPEERNGTYGLTKDDIAYCGPYMVTSHADKNTIVYDANPSYWNADNINVKKITWYYEDGSEATKLYDDFMSGILDRAGLIPSAMEKAKKEGNFDDYAMTTNLINTTRVGFLNINRQMFHLFNDETAGISPQTHESVDGIDRNEGVYTADPSIVDDAARTHAAVNNHNFRLALTCAWDRASYNAQSVGEELKELSLRNSYTPADFVQLGKEVTVDINGKATTFPEGTYYGAIAQAQIDADGYPFKLWDPEANGGLGSGDGFDGFYNAENAKNYLAKAIEELAAQGVEISKENPIYIDNYYGAYSESMTNRANAHKQSIETVLDGAVIINLIPCNDSKQVNSTNYYISVGAENCCDIAIGTGWSADYADPSSYLNNVLPYGDGYQTKNLGVW